MPALSHSTADFDPLLACFDGHALIEASAGTGKTWTLTALYARLLLERRLNVSQILVVTYTQAATAELRDRIRRRLASLLALYENRTPEEPDDFNTALQQAYPGSEAHRRLLLAVHGFDEASIFTIHGFCQRALQEAAFEAGGDFDSRLTPDDSEILDAVLNDIWRQELAQADSLWACFLADKKITPAWLRQRLRPYLGKPYLEVEPSPEEVALPSEALERCWQSAAQCWQEQGLDCINALQAHKGLSQTTHKVSKFPQWAQELDGYFADSARLLKAPDAVVRLGNKALQAACKKGHFLPTTELAEKLDLLAEALAEALPKLEYRLAALQSRLLVRLNHDLPQRKANQRLQAFDDLLNQLLQALQAEGGETLAASLRETYPLALIDEFQDTDPVQYRIFRQIYVLGAKPAADLCFVGDPKQAIYGFRGADLDTYLKARQETARHYNLLTNYRSTSALLQALNHLFSRPHPFSDQRLSYQPVMAPHSQRPRLVVPDEEGTAALSWVWLGHEALSKAQAEQRAAHDCARRIARLLRASHRGQAGFEQAEGGLKPLKGGEVAVLVANHRQAALVATALEQRGVASVRKGRDSVWHTEEATELAAVLAAYADPSHEGWLRYALATRLLGQDAATLAKAQSDAAFWDQEREQAEFYHQLWQKEGFLRLFRTWLDRQRVAERLLSRSDGERRLTNVLHLGELLQAQYQQHPAMEPLLRWFTDQCAGEHRGDDALLRLESDAERVQIVTIHTSKGLEYPLVFCPFLWDGRLLGRQADVAYCHNQAGQPVLDFGSQALTQHLKQAKDERFAEQLRLVYVALTRARERLWIHWGPVAQKARKDGSLPEEGLHTSALAWLIHGRRCTEWPVLAPLAQELVAQNEQGLYQELQALTEEAGPSMACMPLMTEEAHEEAGPRMEAPAGLSRLSRSLYSAWRVGSFSGLAAGMHREAPDYDTLNAPDAHDHPGIGFHAFPRGARAGTCLHAILEDWARRKGDLASLSLNALKAHGLPEESAALVSAHLQQVLDCPLDGQALRLSGIPVERCLPELGFTFPVGRLEVMRLRTLLGDPAMGLPEPLRQASAQLKFDSLSGFLKGFIDLTFEYQGRWYILDYKSNWLGPDASHYGRERLLQALAAEHYYLQYLIYLVALRRFLRLRLPDFTNAQLGGAYYLFLRGMPEAGVFFDRPSDPLLDALDQLFAEHETEGN